MYLETARNAYGFIGGIDNHCFDEDYIRRIAAEADPERAKAKRPFRLAVIQLGTYDGTIGTRVRSLIGSGTSATTSSLTPHGSAMNSSFHDEGLLAAPA